MTRREKLTTLNNYYFYLLANDLMTDEQFAEHRRVLNTIHRLYY